MVYKCRMRMRIGFARAVKTDAWIAVEIERFRIETRMLACQDQRGRDSPRIQRMRDRRELDSLRPGPDDQPYVGATQPSP
jgi:hypothetical protein